MSVFVVDASLLINWFVPEVDSEAARRWFDARYDYLHLTSCLQKQEIRFGKRSGAAS